jgi:putative lipoprotein
MRMPRPAPIALCLALLLAATARAQEPDPWLGPDKALHFGVSAGLAAGGYAGAALVFEDEPPRLLVGGGLALAVGLGKELLDLAGAGNPSWKDLTWDVLGAATGLALAWAVDHFLIAPAHPKPVVRRVTARRIVPDGPFVFRAPEHGSAALR